MENSIQKAQALFEVKQYSPAIDMCLELIKEGRDKKDAFLIAAKSVLFCLKTPMDEDNNNTFLNTFKNACAEAKTVEEALELERDMTAAFYEWKAESIKAQLANLEKNPTLAQWKEYIPIFLGYTNLRVFIRISARNCQAVNAYCEEKGIEKKELGDKLKEEFGDKFETSEVITDEEIKTLEYETAQRIFANTQAKLSANNDGNGDFMKQVAQVITNELLTAECIATHTLPKKETNPDVRCERLMLLGEIISYLLSAMIYPNGTPMSLYMGNRADKVEELKGIYTEIKELDPSFEAPELPNVVAVEPAAAQSSGGGCYVATAVYGSYDCPEVWTLRRFRDYTLAETWHGRAFIRTYYAISPTLVKWFGHTEWFKAIWKPTLDKMVEKLNTNGVENTPYNDRNW